MRYNSTFEAACLTFWKRQNLLQFAIAWSAISETGQSRDVHAQVAELQRACLRIPLPEHCPTTSAGAAVGSRIIHERNIAIARSHLKTLIVEDDRILRPAFCAVFWKEQGHEVTLCRERQGGVAEAAPAKTFLLVVHRLANAETDGLELARRFGAAGIRRTPISYRSPTKDRREDRLSGLQAGADDFLTKPLDREAAIGTG